MSQVMLIGVREIPCIDQPPEVRTCAFALSAANDQPHLVSKGPLTRNSISVFRASLTEKPWWLDLRVVTVLALASVLTSALLSLKVMHTGRTVVCTSSIACGSSTAFGPGACCQKVHRSNQPSRPCLLPEHGFICDGSICPSLEKQGGDWAHASVLVAQRKDLGGQEKQAQHLSIE